MAKTTNKISSMKKKGSRVMDLIQYSPMFNDYKCFNNISVFISKSSNGIGLLLKNIEGCMVIVGFTDLYFENNKLEPLTLEENNLTNKNIQNPLKINDVIIAVNNVDAINSSFDQLLDALKWRAGAAGRISDSFDAADWKIPSKLHIIENSLSLRIARPQYEEDDYDDKNNRKKKYIINKDMNMKRELYQEKHEYIEVSFNKKRRNDVNIVILGKNADVFSAPDNKIAELSEPLNTYHDRSTSSSSIGNIKNNALNQLDSANSKLVSNSYSDKQQLHEVTSVDSGLVNHVPSVSSTTTTSSSSSLSAVPQSQTSLVVTHAIVPRKKIIPGASRFKPSLSQVKPICE